MMDYVTDTHPLVWYFTEDRRLSKKALATFEETIEQVEIIEKQLIETKRERIAQRAREATTNYREGKVRAGVKELYEDLEGD